MVSTATTVAVDPVVRCRGGVVALAALLSLALVGCAVDGIPSPEEEAFDSFEAAKADAIFDFLRFKTADPALAERLTAQYAEERRAIVAGFRAGDPPDEIMARVANGFVIEPGDSSFDLPDGAVSWLFIRECEVTRETFRSKGERVNLALVGLGNQEIHQDGTAPEKRIDLALLEIPSGDEVTVSTDSFSLLLKGAIVVGAGGAGLLLVSKCRPPPPAAALVCRPRADRSECVLASGTCPGTTNCLVSAREGTDVISCKCQ